MPRKGIDYCKRLSDLDKAYKEASIGRGAPSMGWVTCEECGQVYSLRDPLCAHLVKMFRDHLAQPTDSYDSALL